ncbi:hypothetical protein KFL_007320020 [Klebsormidium nitens]|uniref:Uncharacterized protein n=1 Tax=Klebsormidium nitens TaxID=105231 RepID=A0A1Y1IJX1_KLENI|nr:hypothetical protein KFL_007320020 [Klebsormidium nitens]|eukprot:GAQ91130.1 hypothetical protein KFL_007320020 [Klebsormidium nitens]
MLRNPMRGDTLKKLRQEAGHAALDEVGVNMTAALALTGLELGDGNMKMYMALYGSVKAATQDTGYKMTSMPNPHKVNLERKALIEEVPKAIGKIEVNWRHTRMVYDKELKKEVED